MKKQKAGGALISLLSQVIMIVVGLAYTPIMIRILGQSEYGLYQLVQSVVNYLNLMNFGFSGAYIFYFSRARASDNEKEIADVNGMFMKAFLVISTLCIVAGLFLFARIDILGTHLSADDYVVARQLLVIMVINMAVSFPSSLFTVFMHANERFVAEKLVGAISNILVPILTIPLLYKGYRSVGVVSVTLFLTVFRLVVNAWYCVRVLHIRMNLRRNDKNIVKSLLGYTFFIFLSDVVDQLNSNVDKFLLGRLIGTVSVAIYSVGFNLKYYYTVVSWIVPEMFIPEANRVAIEDKDDSMLTALFTRIGRYNNFILLLIITEYFLLGPAFLRLWVGDGYEMSYYVGLILMSAAYIPSVQTLGVNIQNAKKMHKVRSVVYFVVACINVVCSVFLIKRWGEVGTSLGTLFAVIIGSGIFMNYYYQKYVKLNIFVFWRTILKWTIPALLLCGCTFIVTRGMIIDSWIKFVVFASVYAVAYGLLLFGVGFSADERGYFINRIRKF